MSKARAVDERKTTKYSVILKPIIDLCVQCPCSDVVRMFDCSRLKNKKGSADSLIKKKKRLQAINAGEDVEKREPSSTVGGNAN